MELIAAIILGMAAGAVIGILASRGKQQALATKNEVLRMQVEEIKMQAEAQKAEARRALQEAKEEWSGQMARAKQEADNYARQALQEKEKTSQAALAAKDEACHEALNAKETACREALAAQEKRHAEALAAQQARFDEMMAKVSAQVKSATDDMLKQRQKEFAESSNTNLGQIVNPLRETIEKMKQAMNENTLKQTSMSTEMRTNIEHMMRQSAAAQRSAEELTRVFKHGTKVQGDWGETVLDELLEAQGLTRGIHYDTQAVIRDAEGRAVKTEEGSLMRPDVILHLDQRREVIIDSKVSLTAFIDYVNAETEEARQQYLKAHIDSLQKHVKELSVKDYSS